VKAKAQKYTQEISNSMIERNDVVDKNIKKLESYVQEASESVIKDRYLLDVGIKVIEVVSHLGYSFNFRSKKK
jgi:hypothetical protein